MYEGYLALGGGEVLNSARTVGYTTTVDCPVNWLVCPPCEGIADVLGHSPYHYDNISEAPWYDEQDEPTHRFLGAHGISFEGIPDSTREAEVAEGILDGGVVGRVRNATRRIRVRAMLTALGEDALEVGFSWLNSALTPGRCGLHGDACGAADARFYAACPPTRSEVTTAVPVWNDPLTNLVLNPSMETPGAPVTIATNFATNPSFETLSGAAVTVRTNLYTQPTGVWSNIRPTATPLADGTQFDQIAGVNDPIGVGDWVILGGESIATTLGQPFMSGMEVEVPLGYPAISLFWQWEQSPLLNGEPVTINPGEKKRISLPPGTIIPATSSNRVAVRVGTFPLPVGARFIARKLMAEFASVERPYFDGNTLNEGDWTYAWTGATNGSQSIQMGLPAAGVQPMDGVLIVSSQQWSADRSRSILTISNGSTNDRARVTVSGLTSAKAYTARVLMRLDKDFGTQGNERARTLWASPAGGTAASSPQAPATAGEHLLAISFVAGSTGVVDIDMYNGGSDVGQQVWWDELMVTDASVAEPYFDGATADRADYANEWTGTPDASTSTKVGVGVANVAPPPSDQAVGIQTKDSPARGTRALRYSVRTAPAVGLSATDLLPDTGAIYTLVGKVRPRTRDEKLAPRIRAAAGPVFTAPKDVWTSFRLTIAAGSGANQQTGLLLASNSGHKPGDIIDIDEVLLIEGDWQGPYFDGDYPDSPETDYSIPGTQLHEFAWTGTPNASTSEFRTGNVTEVEDPDLYEDKIFRMVRNLHTVTCVAGPTVIQKYHRGDTWGYQVEFVLVAAVPWMYGDTRPVELLPSIPIVIQDVPFNLVPYPSAELAEGSVITATNYVKNPSVEVNTTDWSLGTDNSVIVSSACVLERTTELEAHGSASARVKFTATTTGTNGHFYVQTTVPLPDLNDLTRFSANLWATASIESGTAVLGNLEHTIYWRNSANATLREDDINVGPAAGGAFSLKSMAPPPVGTTSAILRAVCRVTSFSSGAVIRLYADAAAVTVP